MEGSAGAQAGRIPSARPAAVTFGLGIAGRRRGLVIDYSSTVNIARPPDVVFPYLIEREKQALWSDVAMRPLTDGAFGQGSRMEITFGVGPLKTSLVLEINQVEPGRHLAFRTASAGGINWTGGYMLEPEGPSGTRLSQAGTLEFRGAWRLLEPILGAEIRTGEIKELERLKAVVEARTPGAEGSTPAMPGG